MRQSGGAGPKLMLSTYFPILSPPKTLPQVSLADVEYDSPIFFKNKLVCLGPGIMELRLAADILIRDLAFPGPPSRGPGQGRTEPTPIISPPFKVIVIRGLVNQ
jgi:hypothetical protein